MHSSLYFSCDLRWLELIFFLINNGLIYFFLFADTKCFIDQRYSVYRHYSPVKTDDACALHTHLTHARRASSRSELPRPHPTVATRHLTSSPLSTRLQLSLSPFLRGRLRDPDLRPIGIQRASLPAF